MRLIDADVLKKKKKHSYKEFYENVVSVFDIDNAPTIEAIPVEWVQKRMSECVSYSIVWIVLRDLLREWERRRDEVE